MFTSPKPYSPVINSAQAEGRTVQPRLSGFVAWVGAAVAAAGGVMMASAGPGWDGLGQAVHGAALTFGGGLTCVVAGIVWAVTRSKVDDRQ